MAGAGSGKTRVLTCRIANLLAHGVKPWNILAITFTNKAANEMKSRAANMIGEPARDVWLSTFHSFCARILRFDIQATGFRDRSFVIYDVSDSRSLFKQIIEDLNLDDKIFNPAAVQGRISAIKNMHLFDAAQFKENLLLNNGMNNHERIISLIYDQYEKKMVENNAVDFDDLLLLAVRMLEKFPDIRQKYQARFQYILIDEYQDTNFAQYRLTQLLAAAHHNICVVGDADQSIYGFRGADIRNILSFERDYPEAKVVLLEENYRSTQMILDAANAVIENNIDRKPKALWTQNPRGESIKFLELANERAEAQRIVREIKALVRGKFSYRDIALLYRTNAQSRSLEEAFLNDGIPYIIVGGLKFYDRKEIKNILAYLRVIYNLQDSISLMRIINVPKRGIGQTTLAKLNQYASDLELPLFDVISNTRTLSQAGLTPRAKHNLYDFATFILDCAERQNEMTVPELVLYILNASGMINELETDKTIENETRLENLGEFVNVARDFSKSNPEGALEDFLNHIALITDLDNLNEERDCVSLMTVHSAKGLEFPAVFVTGMEEGLFPHYSALMDEAQLEEERRAAYVAITRAKEKLFITRAAVRSNFGKERITEVSRFVQEIPSNLIVDDSQSVRYRSAPSFSSRPIVTPPPSKKIIQMPTKKFVPNTGINWAAGDRLRHGKWGVGKVVKVVGTDQNAQLTVDFEDASIGRKNLIVKYAPIEKI